MWDVLWTDPDKELVGEHRARKEKEESQKISCNAQSGRRSVSMTSSRSSMDSPFSIFRAKGLRRTKRSSSNAQMTSSSSSIVESTSVASARSLLSRALDDKSFGSPARASSSIFERRAKTENPLSISPVTDQTDANRCKLSLSLSNDDSVFSTSPFGDLTAASSADEEPIAKYEKPQDRVQTMPPSSSIVKQPELCLSRDDTLIADEVSKCLPSDPLTPPISPSKIPLLGSNKPKLDSPVALMSPSDSSLGQIVPSLRLSVMPNNPDLWKPLGHWDPLPSTTPKKATKKQHSVSVRKEAAGTSTIARDFKSLQAEVAKMAATKAPEILSRLKELWIKSLSGKEVNLFLGHSEAVVEQRRWMLSAMIHMDQLPTTLSRRTAPQRESPMTATMVLSLYDSFSTVSYLATLYPEKQIYHLSTSNASHEQLGNVQQISVSKILPTEFPVAPRLFETVHSLSLPSLCQASLLPGILRNMHKCLKKEGSCRLVLIDPLPRATTMGNKLKGWIEEHLLRNLARQGRCMSPSTLFPPLLAESGLRGTGSMLTTTKFYAVPESAVSQERDTDMAAEKLRLGREAKAQVRSLVGRMLWVEVWGQYVTTNKWWWDDPACVDECLELGTFWDYHAIRGVKSSG